MKFRTGPRSSRGRMARAAAAAVAVAGLVAASGAPGTHPSRAARRLAAIEPLAAPAQAQDEQVAAYQACRALATQELGLGLGDPASVYLAGWSDAAKLGGALLVGSPTPALVQGTPAPGTGIGYVNVGVTLQNGDNYNCEGAALNLSHRRIPPATATLLGFGFMPVTATAYLTQVGPANCPAPLTLSQCKEPPLTLEFAKAGLSSMLENPPPTIVSTADVTLRIGNVKVNGVPLDVGGDCHTTGELTSPDNPFFDQTDPHLVLAGGADQPGVPAPQLVGPPQLGGAIDGTAHIPPFTGCGPGGDLDPLLDAAVSGGRNHLKMIVGSLCAVPLFDGNCAQDSNGNTVNTPLFGPYWKVRHGGQFTGTGTAPLTISQFPCCLRSPRFPTFVGQTTITCPGSAIAGKVENVDGPPRGDAGTVTWAFPTTCTGSDRDGQPTTWAITQVGNASLAPGPPLSAFSFGSPVGDFFVRADGITLTLKQLSGPFAPCTVTITGSVGLSYTPGSPPALAATNLAGPSDGQLTVPSSTCGDIGQVTNTAPTGRGGSAPGSPVMSSGNGVYPLSAPISITGFSPFP